MLKPYLVKHGEDVCLALCFDDVLVRSLRFQAFQIEPCFEAGKDTNIYPLLLEAEFSIKEETDEVESTNHMKTEQNPF